MEEEEVFSEIEILCVSCGMEDAFTFSFSFLNVYQHCQEERKFKLEIGLSEKNEEETENLQG